MEYSEARRMVKLQGPKPKEPLMVRESMKMKNSRKNNVPNHSSSPVVIYVRSPKVFHVKPEEFMGLVQRLTGN